MSEDTELNDFNGRIDFSHFDKEQRALLKVVDLGHQALAFLQSDLGLYLQKRMDEARAAALEELAEADPEDSRAVRRLQNVVYCMDALAFWLKDAVAEGAAAKDQLTRGE